MRLRTSWSTNWLIKPFAVFTEEGRVDSRLLIVARACVAVCSVVVCAHDALCADARKGSLWVTAYYAGWMQGWSNAGHCRAQDIDYSAVTHIVHFAVVPGSDGSIDWKANSITEANSSAVVSRAHAAGKRVLIAVGGWGSDVGFREATKDINRRTFVSNLVSFMNARGYDGIDIDWEVLEPHDAQQYISLVTALRTAINASKAPRLLTAAGAWQPEIFARVHQYLDQINIMTYDMSGAWPGWVTWHNAPVYDGGSCFPKSGKPLPSVHNQVNSFIASGVPRAKLGIGIDFYGYVWSGGSGTSSGGSSEPRQTWSLPPSVQANVPYSTIMRDYYRPEYYQWDTSALAAYLKIDKAGAVEDKFVSYDNEASIRSKIEYVRGTGLGGFIIWELGGGYRRELMAGRRNPLLQSIKTSLFTGQRATIP